MDDELCKRNQDGPGINGEVIGWIPKKLIVISLDYLVLLEYVCKNCINFHRTSLFLNRNPYDLFCPVFLVIEDFYFQIADKSSQKGIKHCLTRSVAVRVGK